MHKLTRLIGPLLLALLGLGLGAVAILSIVLSFRDTTGRGIAAPGETMVTIVKPGNYTLWHECKTLREGQFLEFADDLPSGTTIKVVRNSDGTDIPLKKSGDSSFESSGYRRVSVGSLTFDKPGEYRVTVTGLAEKRYLYLDESRFLRLFFKVILLGGCGVLFLLSGIGWGIYALVRESDHAPPSLP